MSIPYIDALNIVADVYGVPVRNVIKILDAYSVPHDPDSVLQFFNETKDIGGSIMTRTVNQAGQTVMHVGQTSVTIVDDVNSNLPIRGKVNVPISTTIDANTGKVVAKAGMREAGSFVVKEVVPAIAAAGIGISLGKLIDSTLYNANPDFWDSHGMSMLDPSTWSSITSGDDSLGATLFNLVFGIDGDETQAYIDEDAYAYLAWWLATQGAFATGGLDRGNPPTIGQTINPAEDFITGTLEELATKYVPWVAINANRYYYNMRKNNKSILTGHSQPGKFGILTGFGANDILPINHEVTITSVNGEQGNTNGNTITGDTMTWYYEGSTHGTTGVGPYTNVTSGYTTIAAPLINFIIQDPIEGLGNQDGATLPSTSDWTDVDSTKQSLQNTYPDLWNNAKHYDMVNGDGTTTEKTYIPIPIPSANDFSDDKPTSDTSTQTKPDVSPGTDTETLTDLITKIITEIYTPTDVTPTGEGDSPVTPVPVGQASNLWRIYNPTQAQVDSFGGWLWSSNFFEQIKKLFNDPMQAIIGIHKVFVNPSIGGQTTIQCGYLDSQVPSDWVDEQYVTVDCGTISLTEQYLGVFDYSPYTEINMFLPFIGIVPLDVGDCMRGKINVKYHVDVLTGACLAEIRVIRDGYTVCMYTYSGSAIVSYPLSSGSYMGIIGGTLAIAGGIVGTAASGGAMLPALLGAGAGATHLHTNVRKSGDFSGCAGAMGIKKPYLIISRPQLALATDFEHFTGIPANSKVRLANCSGYTRVKKVYSSTIHYATEEEKDMIDAELKAGVLI